MTSTAFAAREPTPSVRCIQGMRRYLPIIIIVFLAAAACGTADGTVRTAGTPVSTPDSTPDAIVASAGAPGVLIRTVEGVANAEAGTSEVRWTIPGAVAAIDGSAVFSTNGDDRLVRIDPESGAPIAEWPTDPTLTPVLVEPGGGRVIMSDRPITTDSWTTTRDSTRIVVVDTELGDIGPDLRLAGDFEPEAFSVEPGLIFGLAHRGDHYRVQWFNLASGERGDVSDREKNPGGDMRGHPIHGVLSGDGQMLSTLYVNADDPDDPAFVHVLDLGGLTYCVDLPADFASGPARSQSLEITDGDVLIARAPAVDRVAEFDLGWLRREAGPEPARIRDGAGTAVDAVYRDIPGFLALLGHP